MEHSVNIGGVRVDSPGAEEYNTREREAPMYSINRRRAAWLLLLVLALELAVVCCASIHLSDHICRGHETEACAICACLRTGLRRAAPAALLALAALLSAQALRFDTPSRKDGASDTLIARKIRLND